MNISREQQDHLQELVNIAFSRAAGSLSELVTERVSIEIPRVRVHPIEEVASALTDLLGPEVVSVHQVFSGPMSGDAFFLFGQSSAVQLAARLTNQPAPSDRLDPSSAEVVTEVGNILLNGCLGMFGEVLKVHVSFSVPRLHLESLTALLRSIHVDSNELRHAMLAYTSFKVRGSSMAGYLVVVLGVDSLEELLKAASEATPR